MERSELLAIAFHLQSIVDLSAGNGHINGRPATTMFEEIPQGLLHDIPAASRRTFRPTATEMGDQGSHWDGIVDLRVTGPHGCWLAVSYVLLTPALGSLAWTGRSHRDMDRTVAFPSFGNRVSVTSVHRTTSIDHGHGERYA